MSRSHSVVQRDSSGDLDRLLDRYARTRRSITVNFRRLVPWISPGERATHYLHPYPAKLLPNIPAFFLSSSLLSSPGDTVLDPFCGSGTVLLEALIHDRGALGTDANPLARLIATVKTTPYQPPALRRELASLTRSARRSRAHEPPDVVNLDYWFYPHVIEQLTRLSRAISRVSDACNRDFFLVCFSVCVRRVSLADPRLSVPVRLRVNQYPAGHPFRESTNKRLRSLRRQDVFAVFEDIVHTNLARLEHFRSLVAPTNTARVIGTDARRLPPVSSPVDLVITSPPYAGAQKYIRASSLSLGWLDMMSGETLRQLEDKNIGREHLPMPSPKPPPATGLASADARIAILAKKNALRGHIAATYLVEMREALAEAARALKPGGHLVLVAGNNRVCGSEFRTQHYLREILEAQGLVTRLCLLDAIRSRGLMTRRNATASVITRECVMLLQKPKVTHA